LWGLIVRAYNIDSNSPFLTCVLWIVAHTLDDQRSSVLVHSSAVSLSGYDDALDYF